ncbi:MAG TPA: hypothetical protein VF468_23415 [Actinomycetota bacterium]|nr:hypothetical protein [Actinomycetota bacterium]
MARGGGGDGWLRAGVLLGTSAAIVLALYLVHPLLSGYRFPVGPDGPVYSWLAAWAADGGLRVGPGGGPGVPALTLTLGGVLGADAAGAVTILGPVLATICGLAAAGLMATTAGTGRWAVAGAIILTGAFTAYLAGGWLANVTMVALFLAALAALAVVQRSWRAVLGTAALLAAAGLAHQVFVLIGLAILVGVIILHLPAAARESRSGTPLVETAAARMAVATVGSLGGWLLGAAWLPDASLPGDTSQDGFFRRAELRSLLLDRYRERFLGDLGRAAVPVAAGVGLGVAGVEDRAPAAPERRYLMAVCGTWGALTALGIVLLAVTGWGPPNRLLQFAFFLPLVAALGLAALIPRGGVAAVAALLAAAAFVAASMAGWLRQSPAVSADELAEVAAAGRTVDSAPPGTPLVFLVDTREGAAAYHVTRAGNVIRMGIPAERIDDVRLAVGAPQDLLAGRPTLTGDHEHDAASAFYLREARPVLDSATVLVLERFNAEGFAEARQLGDEVAPGVVVLAGEASPATFGPQPEGVGPWALIGWSAAAVLLLLALGGGWARWALPGCGPAAVLGTAPSLGIASAILGTFVADRGGLRPGGTGSMAIVVLLGVAGYVAAARAGRRGHQGRLAAA